MIESSRALVIAFVASAERAADGRLAPPRAEQVALDLLERWAEPQRHYHTVAHLIATLDALHDLLAEPPDAAALELAVWFHDAVYQGRPGDDEESSAKLAEEVLPEVGIPRVRVREVARLVRLTATHDPASDDEAGRLLCDADLAVLGADEATYRQYAGAVRREYLAVPEPDFRAGRAAVLTRLVAAPTVYRTPRAQQLWESAARANVAAELARLADLTQPLG